VWCLICIKVEKGEMNENGVDGRAFTRAFTIELLVSFEIITILI
jgi:hypothetical protein